VRHIQPLSLSLADGGFMATQTTDSPSGGGGGKKRQRAQNVIPVQVSDVLDYTGETMTVEGQEVGFVVLVGQVRSVDHQVRDSHNKAQFINL